MQVHRSAGLWQEPRAVRRRARVGQGRCRSFGATRELLRALRKLSLFEVILVDDWLHAAESARGQAHPACRRYERRSVISDEQPRLQPVIGSSGTRWPPRRRFDRLAAPLGGVRYRWERDLDFGWGVQPRGIAGVDVWGPHQQEARRPAALPKVDHVPLGAPSHLFAPERQASIRQGGRNVPLTEAMASSSIGVRVQRCPQWPIASEKGKAILSPRTQEPGSTSPAGISIRTRCPSASLPVAVAGWPTRLRGVTRRAPRSPSVMPTGAFGACQDNTYLRSSMTTEGGE